jgi:malate dehydrogenase (oxaloacetate-decarboxylating)(NADP+)
MFLMAAWTLAGETSAADLEQGRLYPFLGRIREVSLAIATTVVEVAHERGLATVPPHTIYVRTQKLKCTPRYLDYIRS